MRGSVLACLACLAVAGLAACQGREPVAPTAALEWTRVPAVTTTRLTDVWGASAADVWIVGDDGTILHYDGRAWTRALEGVTAKFTGVWGSGPSDVWAVGYRSFTDATCIVYRYDGRAWSAVALPVGIRALPLTDIWGSSASNVWAVGLAGQMLHYDGVRWRDASVDPWLTFERIWGTSPSDAWIVGPGTVVRGDATGWRAYPLPVSTIGQLSAGWGASPIDHWAAGHGLAHFDGTAWTRVTPDDTATGWFRAMAGVARSRVWAVMSSGSSGTGTGAVWQYDGVRWTVAARTTDNLFGVWAASATDVWAVGDRGLVLHGVAR
ncbi:MAG TPA: hypothetical protein VFV33_01415 [Gemmatimonadaceae bacterium]|nr:hypothetical protein [Gemmatimonadaceae bacterium]